MAKTQTSSSRLTTLAEKNIQEKLSLTTDGIVQEEMGDIYVSVDVVTDVIFAETTGTAVESLSKTAASFVNSISTTSVPCEACGEEETFVTSVTGNTATAISTLSAVNGNFVTGSALTKTTEEHLMPLICTDSYGNFQKVVRTSNVDDTIEDLINPRPVYDPDITS